MAATLRASSWRGEIIYRQFAVEVPLHTFRAPINFDVQQLELGDPGQK